VTVEKNIILNFPKAIEPDMVHKIRNFSEELYGEIEETGLADMGGLEAADSVTTILKIEVKHAKKVRTTRKIVGKLLDSHFLTEVTKVTYR
jgi:hypothetical protein